MNSAELPTNKLLDAYTVWLREQYTIKSLDIADEITTPFVNSIGDNMRIYVQPLSKNKIKISDDGITLEDLELTGVEISNYRKKIIDSVKSQFSIDQFDDVLSVSGSINDFPEMKQRLTNAILMINDLVYTKKKNIESLFFEEVYNYLEENDFGGLPKYTFEGQSGVPYTTNYVIPAKYNRPMRIIDFQNKISKDEMMVSAYKINDILKNTESTSKTYRNLSYSIIYNDNEAKLNANSKKIADNSDIQLFNWSDKQSLLAIR
ncbi:MAG: DUF1828 domain-containing protein [Lactobacillus sp.]|mgnify:CR=1 FL=1|nr:MAG: DUF1828 domain-containing protein [Lactobacillus sp.]